MKFIVPSQDLLERLLLVNGAVVSKPVLPILENFLFKIEESKLTISSTDLETSMTTSMEVQSKDSVSVAVPSKLIIETLRSLPSQPVTFTVDPANFNIELSTANGRFKLAGLSADDYPKISDIESTGSFNMPAKLLSELGEEAIEEMNRVGIMIDISHPSKEANIQMIQQSKAPVIASHSSARRLCDHSRNLDNELLQMIKNNGGVVQTVAFSSYIDLDKHNANTEASKELYKEIASELGITYLTWDDMKKLTGDELETAYENAEQVLKIAQTRKKDINAKYPLVNVNDFVNHIDYMVNKMGIDHVGISSDFDGGGGIEGWNDASETFNVTYELVRRGYSEEDIAKVCYQNVFRVWQAVEDFAENM